MARLKRLGSIALLCLSAGCAEEWMCNYAGPQVTVQPPGVGPNATQNPQVPLQHVLAVGLSSHVRFSIDRVPDVQADGLSLSVNRRLGPDVWLFDAQTAVPTTVSATVTVDMPQGWPADPAEMSYRTVDGLQLRNDLSVRASVVDEDYDCGSAYGVALSHWPQGAVAWYLTNSNRTEAASVHTFISLPEGNIGCYRAMLVFSDGHEQVVLFDDDAIAHCFR